MKILPIMSRGVPFVRGDDTLEMVPMQVWRDAKGSTVIRLGKNAYFFDEDGKYDGSEHKATEGRSADKTLTASLEASSRNRGLPPEEAYYPEGTPAHARETAAWPAAAKIPGGKVYTVKH